MKLQLLITASTIAALLSCGESHTHETKPVAVPKALADDDDSYENYQQTRQGRFGREFISGTGNKGTRTSVA